MFTTSNDFNKVPFSLPGVVANSDFNEYATAVEKGILVEMLGYDFYKQFIDGLGDDPVLDKWTKLRDGAEYTTSNIKYEWGGMKQMLKPVVYSKWTEHNVQSNQGIGGVSESKSENASVANPTREIVISWNCFVDLSYSLFGYLYANQELYDAVVTMPKYRNVFGI